MRVDAEKDGAQWFGGKDDKRLTPVGGFLRQFRIDEIPQLASILAGDMSFVGPRPERPEFLERLAGELPHYRERLLVQPGLSGWAQVNYPYGATIEDAKRKLEFDLYYIKHMGLLLDLIVLFDTVRIVLMGGIKGVHRNPPHDAFAAATKSIGKLSNLDPSNSPIEAPRALPTHTPDSSAIAAL
jgi:lipopolysaccharide/colanic/teichoic acid biosynthesis glycosyltransferase